MSKYLLLFLVIVIIACSQPKEEPYIDPMAEGQIRWIDYPKFGVLDLDSCQYIASEVAGGYQLTHKGNCKYCTLRKDTTSLKPLPVEEEIESRPAQGGIAKHQ